ncbi:MAG TPA: cysteine hydrolase family protein [Bacillales bacterium]|nr:cysteine hydrolase family protein [Bacillales bacterium]
MKTALLVIDMQKDYFPGGRMELEGTHAAAQNVKTLLGRFRKIGDPIVFMQHVSLSEQTGFFLQDTEGIDIHESVEPQHGEVVMQKHFPNSFRGTDLLEYLKRRDVKQLVICGAMSHMCVDATTRAAVDYGFRCTVVEDACATKRLVFNGDEIPAGHVHGTIMAALNGIYAEITDTDHFLSL